MPGLGGSVAGEPLARGVRGVVVADPGTCRRAGTRHARLRLRHERPGRAGREPGRDDGRVRALLSIRPLWSLWDTRRHARGYAVRLGAPPRQGGGPRRVRPRLVAGPLAPHL